jgi:aspartyl-tRNA(Asn)/glutamyl-tRNA(Gln) amidotransferase subunit A
VTDAALLLDVMAEPDARDWLALPPTSSSFAAGIDDGVEGLRIAFSPELGYAAVDPELSGIVNRAALAFAELGAHVEMTDPGFADPREAFDVLWSSGAARAVAATGEVDDPGLREIAAAGSRHAATDYIAALQARDALAQRMSLFHEEWDLLLTPTLPLAAFEAGREVPEGAGDPRWPGWTPFTFPFNMTQQPAATVPCGFTAAGLPVGLQIVGPRYADALVLRAARAYESARPEPTLAD